MLGGDRVIRVRWKDGSTSKMIRSVRRNGENQETSEKVRQRSGCEKGK